MNQKKLGKHLSLPGAWAYSIGTSVGWGSLVVTSNTYLVQAGPMGSILGLVLGAVVMLVVGWNYAYMMRCYPEAGGAYAFARETFGYDYGFLTAWFLTMTYLAILWANATSLPLFGRIFLGGFFQKLRLYTIFSYEVYLGEVLLSVAAIVLFGFLCTHHARLVNGLMMILSAFFFVGITVCFLAALFGRNVPLAMPYLEDASALSQIVKIALISPWAFIGFECISHASEELSFEHKKLSGLMLVSVLSTLALYIFVTFLSVTAYPAKYDGWLSYLRDLDHLEGIEALPAFYAANHYLGKAGVTILMLSLLALVITSLIGNMMALSRLFYAMAKDRILPERFAVLGNRDIPENALWLVVMISAVVPFAGRTAIGWIVDVTTIGATLIYGLVSAATFKLAREMKDRRECGTGLVGLIVMALFGACFLLPNFVSRSSIARETFLLFIIWSVFGFLFFRSILRRDKEKRYGTSAIVWVALLSLVLFVSFVWMRQSMIASDDEMRSNLVEYSEQGRDDGSYVSYVEAQLQEQSEDTSRIMLMALGMFGFVLVIMLTNHSYMNKRSNESEMMANTDAMTGVRNKHAFMLKEKEFNVRILGGTVKEFAVVVCDVNGLKKINDTLGHKAGDEYICAACKMICEIYRHSPVFRIGGDEFVSILTGRDYQVRRELMKLLHDRSAEHITAGGAVVSGGMSEYALGEDQDFHAVFTRADALMYEEKKLLKSLGAVTRDDESDKEGEGIPAALEEARVAMETAPILQVRRSILIVEDEIINQQMLGYVLEEDYEILYASDGVEALEQTWEHKDEIALIMLDLNMPRMNGTELIGRLKEDPDLKLIPIIVLTADQKSEVDCLQMGAMDFLSKPYPVPEIIRARVDKCIELSEDRSIIQSTERDSLTKLFNMDYFLRYVHLFDQHYPDSPMDAVVLDVNQFHIVNERYGKQYGDGILRKIGERVRQQARRLGGVGCRQGADEFLIYCPHRNSYEELFHKVSDGLGKGEGQYQKIRMRMGIYYEVDKTLDVERRFDRAKLAADQVKTNYAKSIGEFDLKMHDAILFKNRLLEDFRTSLEQKCFTVFFQPKFDVRGEEPVLSSAEALVRWKHPELGMISPGTFIPLLEEHGLIMDLDRFVWEETAARIRAWKEKYGYAVPVSVNVSRIDMLMPNLKEVFTGILEKYGLSADDLILEITESAYTGDAEQVISTARELRGMGMGFRIEMDDFGTGYSSLGMLSSLPIDALKLDMSFVRSAFGESRDMRMIELIIDVADYLHVPVVAEGVETNEQYLTLKAMGCDLVQGYYFSKPVPAEDFEAFLTERGKKKLSNLSGLKRNYVSISKALTCDYERIYYVDAEKDCYLEFYAGEAGELQMRMDGGSFFETVRKELLGEAAADTAETLGSALEKDRLLAWAEAQDAAPIVFQTKDGERSLHAISTRNQDKHHIVIGLMHK